MSSAHAALWRQRRPFYESLLLDESIDERLWHGPIDQQIQPAARCTTRQFINERLFSLHAGVLIASYE